MKKIVDTHETVYPHFLENQPCGEDLFEGKSHEKIATQIANLLQNNDTINAIGIDGGWGSGKSNLVKLVKKHLDEEQYHFLIYDAWGFQTDFQRRSILENITSDLIDSKLIANDKWNGRLLQLLSRKRTVGTKVMRGLNPIAKIGGVVALLSPIGIPLVNLIPISWIKWLIYIFMVLIAISVVIYLQLRDMQKYGQPISFATFCRELFVSYLDYTYDKSENKESIERSIKYETIYDEEPSSRDFRLWMKDIDEELKGRKFILVIDNMDRLPKIKVQELWSAINTLFAEQHYKNIIIIVPFDRDHIKSAFRAENIRENKDFGNDFINKTFSVVYRVSPPIMSDWKHYFTIMWEKAFGRNATIDENITQIYDLLAENKTPRDITAFINKFVSLRQISDETIPDRYLALYICGEQKIKDKPLDEITKPSYLGALNFLYEKDDQLPKYIAALYYQIEPNRAIEVAYLDRLRKALDNGDKSDVTTISTLTNFEDLLENAITSVSNVPNAVTALYNCGVSIHRRFWDMLYSKISIPESSLQEYQIILINSITASKEYTQRIVNEFYNANNFDAISYHQSIMQLVDNKKTDPIPFLQQKVVNPKVFVEYVKHVKAHYNDYLITCDAGELDEYLGKYEIEDLKKLTIIPDIRTSYPNLPNYKLHLEELIDNNVGDLGIVSTCYKLLKEMAHAKTIDKQLTAQQIYTLFNNCDDTNDFRYDLIAMRLAQYTNIPIASNTNKIISCIHRTDEEFVEKVAAVIEYYTSYNDILIKSPKISNQELFKEIAIILTKETHGNSRLNLQQVLNHYDTIKQYLELDAETIIARFNESETDEMSTNTVTTIPLLFFKDIAENNIKNELTDHCIAQYTSYLNTISTENWKDHIEAKDKEYEMLQYIGKNKIQGCFDAFSILLVDKATESNNILSTEKRDYLLNLAKIKGYKLTRIFNSVRDKYCTGSATMTAEHFQYFGELLLQYATLNNQSVLCNIFPNNLFDYDNNVAIIIKYKDIMLSVYNLAGDGEKEDFQRKLQTLIDGKYKDKDNAPQGFEEFAGYFGVSKASLLDKITDSITEKLTK